MFIFSLKMKSVMRLMFVALAKEWWTSSTLIYHINIQLLF